MRKKIVICGIRALDVLVGQGPFGRTSCARCLERRGDVAWKITLPSIGIFRGLASTDDSEKNHDATMSLLRSLHGAEFQPHLQLLQQEKSVISWKTLLEEFRRGVPTATASDAERVCSGLAEGGIVLRQGDLAYLRPKEIVDTLQQVLPVDIQLVEERLAAVENEFATMEAEYQSIRSTAARRTKIVNYALFSGLLAQWGILFRLTYWELSWDVIEPAGFFVGGAMTILSMAYFLRTQRDFTYEAMHERFMGTFEKKLFEARDFDIMKYRRLQLEADRLRMTLEAAKHTAPNCKSSANTS